MGLFKITFSTFWLGEPKCTETDLKKSQISPIWGQSDPIWMPNEPKCTEIDLKKCKICLFWANLT